MTTPATPPGMGTPAGFTAAVADWLVLIAAIFHTARARQPDDPGVMALEHFAKGVIAGLLRAGVPEEEIDRTIQALAVCEACGCADHRACPGTDQCHWLEEYLDAQRFVCSRCAGKASAPAEPRYSDAQRLILAGDPRFKLPVRG